MKKNSKKSVIERPQVLRSIKYAEYNLDAIRNYAKAAKVAHRKIQAPSVYANALIAHVVDILERGGVDFKELPAWECAVRKHG